MSKEQATYSHGHHKSVVASHARRTAEDSAAFLLPHIRPTDHILDVGCGPGSITVDFAKLVPEGKVIGIDAVEQPLNDARDLAQSRGLSNIIFSVADANQLPYPDATFDITYAHQTLQHVKDPVSILKEMRRVTKPGGIVSARDADYAAFAWYPTPPALDKWGSLYQKVAYANGGEPNAGRRLHIWAKQAGFTTAEIQCSASAWAYTGEKGKVWGETWKERSLKSDFAKSALAHGLANQEDLDEISKAWEEWGEDEDCYITIPCNEILCRVP